MTSRMQGEKGWESTIKISGGFSGVISCEHYKGNPEEMFWYVSG